MDTLFSISFQLILLEFAGDGFIRFQPAGREKRSVFPLFEYPEYSGYVDHNCEDGKAYGLDVGLTVTVFYGEEEEALTEDTSESVTEGVFEDLSEAVGEKETDLFSGKDSLVLHVGDPTGEGGYYVQLEGSKEVHIFSEEKLDGLISLL